MGARRRKKSPRKVRAATNTSASAFDHSKEQADPVKPTIWAILRRDDTRPIPLPPVAAIVLPTAIFLGLRFPNYVACPQQTHGQVHAITSIAAGEAIGGGVTAILMIAVILGVERVANSVSAVRAAVERAGIGAIYGTLASTLATFNIKPGSECSPELFSNISNGATWGSMLGLALSLLTLRKQIIVDLKILESERDRVYLKSLSISAVLLGIIITLTATSKLLSGDILPS